MGLSHPRRQQLRRLRKASRRGAEASLVLAGAAVAADVGALAPAILAGIVGVGLLGNGVIALRRAGRSRVGAVSEARVRRALDTLRAEGWRVQHGVSWRGRGDIDHVVCSPGGLGFAIETKTRRYTQAHLARTAATARWLARRHRRYPRGVVAIVCIVTAPVEGGSRARPARRIAGPTTRGATRHGGHFDTIAPNNAVGRAARSPRRAAASVIVRS